MASIGTSCALLGLGCVAMVTSAVLDPSGAVETAAGVAAAGVAGRAGVEGLKAVAGNFTSDALKGGYQAIIASLAPATTHEDPLHRLLPLALRQAHLDGLDHVLATQAALLPKAREAAEPLAAFLSASRQWVRRQREALQRSGLLAASLGDEEVAALDALISGGEAFGGVALSTVNARAVSLAIKELEAGAGASAPVEFVAIFNGEVGLGWLAAAQTFFAERLFKSEALKTAMVFERLNKGLTAQAGIETRLVAAQAAIRSTTGELGDRLTAIEAILTRLVEADKARQIDWPAVYTALAEGQGADRVGRDVALEQLNRHGVGQTARQVARRIASLDNGFFGRGEDLRTLDRFVDEGSGGLLLLTARAGAGKSALLAHWCRQRRDLGVELVRHFISNTHDKTTAPDEILGHLLAQLNITTAPVFEAAASRGQTLYAQINARAQTGERLIVVIDGLDETTTLLEPFIEAELPPNVFLIVSGRAADDEHPPSLAAWEKRLADGLPGQRWRLAPLSLNDIETWLRSDNAHDALTASAVLATSEGLPLLIGFLVEDANLAVDGSTTFGSYLEAELRRHGRPGEPNWSADHRRLFAVLASALAPIALADLVTLDARLAMVEPADLHHRFSRWLAFSGEDGQRLVSFSHPLIRALFAKALKETADQARDDLIAWCLTAWQGPVDQPGARRASSYAIDWVVAHLRTLGQAGEDQAARLMTSPQFLGAQLSSSERARTRLQVLMSQWAALPRRAQQRVDGATWSAFWRENAHAVLHLVGAATLSADKKRLILLRALGDAGCLVERRAKRAHPSPDVIDRDERAMAMAGFRPHRAGFQTWTREGVIRTHDLDGAVLATVETRQPIVRATDLEWGWELALNDASFLLCDTAARPLLRYKTEVTRLAGLLQRDRNGDHLVVETGICFPATAEAQDLTINIPQLAGMFADAGRPFGWSEGGTFHRVDLARRQIHPLVAHQGRWSQITDWRDGWLTTGDEGRLKAWSRDLDLLHDIQAHDQEIWTIAAEDDLVVTGDAAGVVTFWNGGLTPICVLRGQHERRIDHIEIKATFVLTHSDEGTYAFWRRDGTPLSQFKVAGVTPKGMLSSPEGHAIFHSEGYLCFLTLAFEVAGFHRIHNPRHERHPLREACVVDGQFVVTRGSDDGMLEVWSFAGQRLASVDKADAVLGMIALAGGLMTASESDLRFWTIADLLAKANPDITRRKLVGAAAVGEAALAWYEDGYLGLVRPDGSERELQASGAPPILEAAIRGAHCLTAQLGRVTLWSEDGVAARVHATSGTPQLHDLGARLVISDEAGQIIVLDAIGEVVATSRLEDAQPIRAFHPTGDGYVSQGERQLRFWTEDFEPRPVTRKDVDNFLVKVVCAPDATVAWYGHDALFFFSPQGEYRAVSGPWSDLIALAPIDGGVVSLDENGGLRLWDDQGHQVRHAETKHDNLYSSITPLETGLLVKGSGEVTFWSFDLDLLQQDPTADDIFALAPDGEIAARAEALVRRRRDGGDERLASDLPVWTVFEGEDLIAAWSPAGFVQTWTASGQPLDSWLVPGGVSDVFQGEGEALFVRGRDLWVYEREATTGTP